MTRYIQIIHMLDSADGLLWSFFFFIIFRRRSNYWFIPADYEVIHPVPMDREDTAVVGVRMGRNWGVRSGSRPAALPVVSPYSVLLMSLYRLWSDACATAIGISLAIFNLLFLPPLSLVVKITGASHGPSRRPLKFDVRAFSSPFYDLPRLWPPDGEYVCSRQHHDR